MIQSIFFDLDDTLLWDKKSVKEAFAFTCQLAYVKYGVSPDELEETVRKEATMLYTSYHTYEFTKMIGINPFEGLWGHFSDKEEGFRPLEAIVPTYRKEAWIRGLKRVGIDDQAFGEELSETFPRERRKHPYVFEETFSVLDRLKGNYKLLLLTNGSPELQKTKLDMTPELSTYFDQIIISGAFGRGKPDPTIFEHSLERLGGSKKTTLMVGDNLMTDILGANRAGMTTVWVNREKEDKTEVIPDFEIHHLEALFPILESLNKDKI